MSELTTKSGTLNIDARSVGESAQPARLTPGQWLICGVAALGFAFDLYEGVTLAVVVRPALTGLGNLKPGTPEFNFWVGLLFYVPAAAGGAFGLLGGYLTDLFGRRRVLFWTILLYSFSAFAASHATTLLQFLIFRCTTIIGVSVEYVAAVTWLAELFSNSRQRERVLGFTQTAFGMGGLMATGAYYLAVTYAERFPALHGGHEAWRYTLIFGLFPAIPLILVRPFLPESPIWREKKSQGTLKRPSVTGLLQPRLRKTTLVVTLLVACVYALGSGVLQQTPRMVPGLPEVRGLAPRQVEQAVGSVQFIAETGTTAGRLLFAILVIWVTGQRRFLRLFLVPGSIVFSVVYFYAATHSLALLKCGIFLAALLMNGTASLLWNYLPRVYPTHLRATGESFAANIGGRTIGAFAAVLTTQLAGVIPAGSAATRLAYSAAAIVVMIYSVSLTASFWFREPEGDRLPD